MSTTKKLRLGPLPKTESVKLTFACPASLKADLDRYAALHAQAYGEAVDAATLDPAHAGGVHGGGSGIQEGHGDPERAIEADMMASHTNGIHRTRSHRLRVLHSPKRANLLSHIRFQALRDLRERLDTGTFLPQWRPWRVVPLR
jgi:hypothetical protein